MQLIRDLRNLPASCHGMALAIGNFDGVHAGHQAIIRECLRVARAYGAPAAVMTFEPHPREFFAPGAPLRIYPFRAKAMLLREFGVEALMALRFNMALAQTPPEAFIRTLLCGQLKVSHIITGENFSFGANRGGSTAMLAREAERLGFRYTALPPVQTLQKSVCSSSAIRAFLAAGDVAAAEAMLGRPYAVSGRVHRGDRRGRVLGFPTLNLIMPRLFVPAFGVYAARAVFERGGKRWAGVVNLGVRPTFGGGVPVLEAHLFDFSREVYGERVSIELLAYLRPERRFADMEALKAQIVQDCLHAREIAYDR